MVMVVGLDPELTKWSMCSGPVNFLTRKGYKEHHWLVVPHQPLQLSPTSSLIPMPFDRHASSSHIIPSSMNHLGIGRTAVTGGRGGITQGVN